MKNYVIYKVLVLVVKSPSNDSHSIIRVCLFQYSLLKTTQNYSGN